MTHKQALIFLVSSVVLVLAGLGIVATGHWFGWVLVALGVINVVIGGLSYRMATASRR